MAEREKDSAKPRRKKKSDSFLKKAFKFTFKAVRAVFLLLWRIVRALWRAVFLSNRQTKSKEAVQAKTSDEPRGLIDRVFTAIQRSDRVWLPSLTLSVVMAGAVFSLIPAETGVILAPSSCVLREQIGLPNLQREWSAVRRWCDLIMEAGTRYQHDPHLLAALILVESGGNPSAFSGDGAVGLMQIMPRDGKAAKFMCPAGPCFASRPSIAELRDPAFNIDYGAQLLRFNITRTGSVRDALRSYGPIYVGYSYADLVLNTYHAVKP